jgi:anaerobic nitric oxide reductase transcription regulator
MSPMLDVLLDVARDLTASLPAHDRYQRLVAAVRRVVPCDAATLMRGDPQGLQVLAAEGLSTEILGRRYQPEEQPRLAAILAARDAVHFPADDARRDPFDGYIEATDNGDPGVHSCMGCALWVDGELVGALTVDALRPGVFNDHHERALEAFAALAAAAMRTAGLIDALEDLAERRGQISRRLVIEALQRGGGEILGQSEVMRALGADIERVAASDLTVLITGETGVGKELVARTLHARSGRAEQALVYINCAALPESIAESELFGHLRGSFTGAVADRAGRFELAHEGTLFLDEIGELPLSIQPKLLRALQQGEVQRVGADQPHAVDVRILAATNRDLTAEVRAGRFRPDLYHRLSVYPIRVPPLRERGQDVLLLAGHFLDQARVRLGTGPVHLGLSAKPRLLGWSWPGNVRELEHVLLRAVLRAGGSQRGAEVQVEASHLNLDAAGLPEATPSAESGQTSLEVHSGQDLRQAVDEFQRQLILQTLARCEGNWAEAARQLGTGRANLHRLKKRLGMG